MGTDIRLSYERNLKSHRFTFFKHHEFLQSYVLRLVG